MTRSCVSLQQRRKQPCVCVCVLLGRFGSLSCRSFTADYWSCSRGRSPVMRRWTPCRGCTSSCLPPSTPGRKTQTHIRLNLFMYSSLHSTVLLHPFTRSWSTSCFHLHFLHFLRSLPTCSVNTHLNTVSNALTRALGSHQTIRLACVSQGSFLSVCEMYDLCHTLLSFYMSNSNQVKTISEYEGILNSNIFGTDWNASKLPSTEKCEVIQSLL